MSKAKTYKMAKVGNKWLKEIKQIQAERILRGVDEKPLKIERVSDAITKTRGWCNVRKEVVDMPKSEDLE